MYSAPPGSHRGGSGGGQDSPECGMIPLPYSIIVDNACLQCISSLLGQRYINGQIAKKLRHDVVHVHGEGVNKDIVFAR